MRPLLALGGGVWLSPALAAAPNFEAAQAVLEDAISRRVFPGATFAIISPRFEAHDDSPTAGNSNAILGAAGKQCYESDGDTATVGTTATATTDPYDPRPCTDTDPSQTMYDLASLTKVSVTTTLAMLLSARGQLDLDATVASVLDASGVPGLGADFSTAGKGKITVRHLLTHTAGFPPDPSPNYWQPGFPCESARHMPYPLQDRSCAVNITGGWLAQGLDHPPGEVYKYSDLSMIVLASVLGSAAKAAGIVTRSTECPASCTCENLFLGTGSSSSTTAKASELLCVHLALAQRWIIDDLSLTSTTFSPPEEDRERCAPAWKDTSFQHRLIRGFVSDGNAYVSGGVAGHAGLFSTAEELAQVVRALAFTSAGRTTPGSGGVSTGLDAATVAAFFAPQDASFSSRALGWDTNAAPHGGSNCGTMTPGRTATHTGYTGTLVCIDTVRGLALVLLTNRAYPDDAMKQEISVARRAFSTAVVDGFDAWVKGGSSSSSSSGSGSGSGDGGSGDSGTDSGKKGNPVPTLHRAVFAIMVAMFVLVAAVLIGLLWRRRNMRIQRDQEREQGIRLVDQSFSRFRSGTLNDDDDDLMDNDDF